MFAVAFIVAVLDWAAVAWHRKRAEYLFKPGTMVAIIIAVVLLMQGPLDDWRARFFLVGLVLSLAGDVFLMLPKDRFFLPGLVSFLLAHLCYIGGLNPSPPDVRSLLVFVPIALLGAMIVLRVTTALKRTGQDRLVIPVVVYALVISLMLFSAWAAIWRADWATGSRVLVILGATLFFASDAMLAWNKFVRRFDHADLAVIVTYHLGQLALASSLAQV